MDTVTNRNWLSRFSSLSGRRLTQTLLLLLIAGLCIANALLIKQNRDLKVALSGKGEPPEFLKPGEHVRPFAATTLSGHPQGIDYAQRAKTVLLVFSPQCAACERTLPHWREIKGACERNQYQILGVSLGGGAETNAFLTSHGFNLDTLVDIDSRTRAAYKLYMTPLTIVIDNRGKVERIWPGAFSRETKQEMERYFGISEQE